MRTFLELLRYSSSSLSRAAYPGRMDKRNLAGRLERPWSCASEMQKWGPRKDALLTRNDQNGNAARALCHSSYWDVLQQATGESCTFTLAQLFLSNEYINVTTRAKREERDMNMMTKEIWFLCLNWNFLSLYNFVLTCRCVERIVSFKTFVYRRFLNCKMRLERMSQIEDHMAITQTSHLTVVLQ